MLKCLISFTLIALPPANIVAQGIDREAFAELVFAVCDHERMGEAFVSLKERDRPVLYVEFPQGIRGVGPDETIELGTRHGLVIMAYEKYIFFFQIKHWLEFKDVVMSEKGVHAYFRTYNHVDATVPIPIIKGSAERKPGKGGTRVRFLKKIPSDKQFKRKR